MNSELTQIASALERLLAAHQPGPWDKASTIAVVLTLGVLIWYTIETYKLRVAAFKQHEVAITPIVMMAPIQDPKGALPAIRNVGNGPAFNLSIEATGIAQGAKLNFLHSDILAGQETQIMHLILQQPHRERAMYTHDDIVANITQSHLPTTFPVAIAYSGANGKAYRTDMTMEYKDELLYYRFSGHVSL